MRILGERKRTKEGTGGTNDDSRRLSLIVFVKKNVEFVKCRKKN